MRNILDNTKALILPYGRYLGTQNGNSIVQVSPDGYRETDIKWDGILNSIAQVPSLQQLYDALQTAGVQDPKKYVTNLENNVLLSVIDFSKEKVILNPIYDFILYPTLNYKGASKKPPINNILQVMVTTPVVKMPFDISLLTTTVLSESLDTKTTIGEVLPSIINEFVKNSGLAEETIKAIFLNDLRTLIQRKGAFLGE